jgi:hypothetical protein
MARTGHGGNELEFCHPESGFIQMMDLARSGNAAGGPPFASAANKKSRDPSRGLS